MSDLQIFIEFCERFGYEYEIAEIYEGGYYAFSQGEEYEFDESEALVQ